MFYGYPGAGKSYVARQLTEILPVVQISADRLRSEIFERPSFSPAEERIIAQLMEYMAGEFLRNGMSVAYDGNTYKRGQRMHVRNLAHQHKATSLLIWLQMDSDSAFSRTQRRDRRTHDDRFSAEHTEASFQHIASGMQNPKDEYYMVISGKHPFMTQKSAIINRLYKEGLVDSSSLRDSVTKPGLVNIIPGTRQGRVDMGRRNISIR